MTNRELGLKPSAQRVLRMLRDAGDRGVTTGEFIRAGIERFSARKLELRKAGFDIDKERLSQSAFRYFLRPESAGLNAETASPLGVESGDFPVSRSEDSEPAAGVGGTDASGGGTLFELRPESSQYDPWSEVA